MNKFTTDDLIHRPRSQGRKLFNISWMLLLLIFLSGCFDSSNDKDLSPIADAGIDQTVSEQTLVTLDGSGTAMAGKISGISWRQSSGDAVTLSDSSAPDATFMAPVTIGELTFTFEITATDDQGRTATDSVKITVLPVNTDPVADAGEDQNVTGGEDVVLSGNGTDSDGSIVSYQWSQISGDTVTLSNADSQQAGFIAPQFEQVTELVFQLSVTDNEAGTATDTVSINVGSKYALADGINGGRLYSKFWATETGFSLTNSNLQDQTELDAITGRSNFFRCKQCHGWDRLGRDGGYSDRAPKTSRPNVADFDLEFFVQNASIAELFNAIKTGSATRRDVTTDLSGYDPAVEPTIGDQMPDYGQIFIDDQIWDLVKFLKKEAYDTTLLYDITLEEGTSYPNRARTFSNIGKDGNLDSGNSIFIDNCASCHGVNGTEFLVDGATYTVGRHLRKKPYEDQHKVKFGHLGSSMVAHPDLTTNDAKDLFKALTDTVLYPDEQTDFTNANGINGGRMYSKFWATETGFTLANSNLQNQAELDAITTRSNFFRCKQCHGWDRLGREGGYSDRAPKTSRPNVADFDLAAFVSSATSQQIFNAIKTGTAQRRDINTDLSSYDPAIDPTVGDQMPDYAQIFTDEQIWDLANFLKNEALDTTQLYDITFDNGVYPNQARTFSDIGKEGDASNGFTIYANKCASCHGADGTAFLVDGGNYTVGRHLRTKPYEDQHKVKFGHLGSTMGAILANDPLSDIKDLFKALDDDVIFPDAQAPATDGAALFTSRCGSCHTGNGLGTGSVSDVTNHTATQITTAISDVATMASLSDLTIIEIQAIADALVQ